MKRKSLTKLESQKLRKKLAAEEDEKLMAMGQESEHEAAKVVKQLGAEHQLKQKKKLDDETTKLEDLLKHKNAYKKFLLFKLHDLIMNIGLRSDWLWGVWFDGRGIVVTLANPGRKIFRRAFVPCYDPKFDYHACYELALWVENVYDENLWSQVRIN